MAWPVLPNMTFAAPFEASSGTVNLFFDGPHIIPVELWAPRNSSSSPTGLYSKFSALAAPSAKESLNLWSRANRTVRHLDLIIPDALMDELLRLNLFTGSFSIFEYPGSMCSSIGALIATSSNVNANLKSESRNPKFEIREMTFLEHL